MKFLFSGVSMGYFTDFVTGRTLMPYDNVIAFIIAPVIHEARPKHRARNPLHEQDEFEALSLPISGKLDGQTFAPSADQQALSIFLESFGIANWECFHERHLVENEPLRLAASKMIEVWSGESAERDVIVAVGYLHETTFTKIVELAPITGDVGSDAKQATAMMLDARKRIATNDFKAKSVLCHEDHDPLIIERIANFGSPREASYMPIGGWWIYTPSVMSFFDENRHPISVGEHLVGSVRAYHAAHGLYECEALEETYANAGSYRRFMLQLGFLGHILRPSKIIMSDNRLGIAQLNSRDIAVSLEEISGNNDIFADWIAHVQYPRLLELRETLQTTLTKLDEEIPRVHKGSKYKESIIYKSAEYEDDALLVEARDVTVPIMAQGASRSRWQFLLARVRGLASMCGR